MANPLIVDQFQKPNTFLYTKYTNHNICDKLYIKSGEYIYSSIMGLKRDNLTHH